MVGERFQQVPGNAKMFVEDVKNKSIVGAVMGAADRFGSANRQAFNRVKSQGVGLKR